MKKIGWLVAILVILGVGFWNVKLQQETVSLHKSVVNLKEQKQEFQDKKEKLLYENERLSDEATASSEALKKYQKTISNSGNDVDLNAEYIDVVTKIYQANLNFDPENYGDRKKEIASYLSDDLNKEYFGQGRKTYQDANGTTSVLESLEIYPKGVQGLKLEGLVVAYHKSRQKGQEWVKGMNIFKVTYDSETKKVTQIVNLGSGYAGDR